MEREAVFDALVRMIQEVMPGTEEAAIRHATTLAELDATSIDRAEIAVGTMEAIGLTLPPAAFLGVGTIAELVDLLWSRSRG
jgi:acyl carrier protein